MKYIFTLAASTESNKKMLENPEAMAKEVEAAMAQLNPEKSYFSTLRRLIFLVVNIDDPHVELRNAFENLSRFGEVTIEPVSTYEEFKGFMKQTL